MWNQKGSRNFGTSTKSIARTVQLFQTNIHQLFRSNFSSLSWSATYVRDGVWSFRGHTWNEVDYEMHYVKWRIKKLAHSCYTAAVKKVHLDAEWHLHFPVRLCYRCFPLPTSNYDYRFSPCTVVLYMSIVFLRPLWTQVYNLLPLWPQEEVRSSPLASDCFESWRNMESQGCPNLFISVQRNTMIQ